MEYRIDAEDFKQSFGQDYSPAIRMLERKLKKIFEPVLLRAGVLNDLENDELMRVSI